jgi:hypothetical protein
LAGLPVVPARRFFRSAVQTQRGRWRHEDDRNPVAQKSNKIRKKAISIVRIILHPPAFYRYILNT